MARRALALSLRRGAGPAAVALDAVLPAEGLLLSARMARAWRYFAISSSMAFSIWSFKLVPFRPKGPHRYQSLKKNNRFGRILSS